MIMMAAVAKIATATATTIAVFVDGLEVAAGLLQTAAPKKSCLRRHCCFMGLLLRLPK